MKKKINCKEDIIKVDGGELFFQRLSYYIRLLFSIVVSFSAADFVVTLYNYLVVHSSPYYLVSPTTYFTTALFIWLSVFYIVLRFLLPKEVSDWNKIKKILGLKSER